MKTKDQSQRISFYPNRHLIRLFNQYIAPGGGRKINKSKLLTRVLASHLDLMRKTTPPLTGGEWYILFEMLENIWDSETIFAYPLVSELKAWLRSTDSAEKFKIDKEELIRKVSKLSLAENTAAITVACRFWSLGVESTPDQIITDMNLPRPLGSTQITMSKEED